MNKSAIIKIIEKCRELDYDWSDSYKRLGNHFNHIHPSFSDFCESSLSNEEIYQKLVSFTPVVLDPIKYGN